MTETETEYDSIADVELTTEHTAFFSKAGASDSFIDFLTFPKQEAGVSRHSVQEEAKKYVYWGDLENDPTTFSHLGGHFFSEIWSGNLFKAWLRADHNNKVLMAECFGTDRIIEEGVQSGQPFSYVKKMVTEPMVA